MSAAKEDVFAGVIPIDELREAAGFDVGHFDPATVGRCVDGRLLATGRTTLAGYLELLRVDSGERARLGHALFMTVTGFFRTPRGWDFLGRIVLPEIAATGRRSEKIRMWSAGCATGEEPVTLAIVAAESLGENALKGMVIYATDNDPEALEAARQGLYRAGDLHPMPARLRRKYFRRAEGGFRVRPDVAACIRYEQRDLSTAPSYEDLSLIVCRQTLMYFEPSKRAALLRGFGGALATPGFLFVESTDSGIEAGNRFVRVSSEHPVYRGRSRG